MREFFRKIAVIFDYLTTQARIGIVLLLGLFFALFIIFTLGRYTLVDHAFYKKLADSEQLRKVELSVNRGTIYATLDPNRQGGNTGLENSIVATTSIAKDLKIDPTASCNLDMMESFLADVVYQHLCLNRSQVSCFDNILKYTNTFAAPEKFNFTRDNIVSFLTPTIHEQTHRINKTRIFLADNVSSAVINTLQSIGNPGILIVGDTVYVDPTRFDASRGVTEIINALNITQQALNDALVLRKNRNVDIVEKLDPELALSISEKMDAQDALVKQQPLNTQGDYITKNTFFKCLKLVDHPVREYPDGSTMAQVTGFVDSDGIGRLGIEGYFQDMLAGKSGITEERRDSLGRPIFDENAEQEVK